MTILCYNHTTMTMKTIYFINPQIIHGVLADWQEVGNLPLDYFTMYANPELADFLALYDSQKSFEFTLCEQFIPFSQWEELALCSRDVLDDFFIKHNEKALGTQKIVLNESDCNMYGILGCITCDEAIAPVVEEYLSQGALFHFAAEEHYDSPFVAFDDEDNEFVPYTIVSLNALPLADYDILDVVHHANQAILYEGTIEVNHDTVTIQYNPSMSEYIHKTYTMKPILKEYLNEMVSMGQAIHIDASTSFSMH